MNENTKIKTNCLPLFYHIPKNSGTYVYNCLLKSARTIDPVNTRVIRVFSEEKWNIAKLIVFNDDIFLKKLGKFATFNNSKVVLDLNIEDLTLKILKGVTLHSVFIEGRGFRLTGTLLEPLLKFLNKLDLYKFIILRDPFSREQSLYHYLTSDKSKHEQTHGRLVSPSFREHVMSNQLQDSWLIRNLVNIPNGIVLTEEHLNGAVEILESFNKYDAKDTDKALDDVLLKCFNIENFNKEDLKDRKNDNVYKKMRFKDLTHAERKTFQKKKYLDNALYSNSVIIPPPGITKDIFMPKKNL